MSSEHEGLEHRAEFETKAKAAEAQGDFCEAAYYRGQRNLAPGTGLDRDSFEDGWTACEAQMGRRTRENESLKAQLAAAEVVIDYYDNDETTWWQADENVPSECYMGAGNGYDKAREYRRRYPAAEKEN